MSTAANQYGMHSEAQLTSGRGEMNNQSRGRQRAGEAQARMDREIAQLRRHYRLQFKQLLQEVCDFFSH
jgi:hypothetical protein